MFTHNKDMKGIAKCINWDGLGIMGLPRSLTGNVTIW